MQFIPIIRFYRSGRTDPSWTFLIIENNFSILGRKQLHTHSELRLISHNVLNSNKYWMEWIICRGWNWKYHSRTCNVIYLALRKISFPSFSARSFLCLVEVVVVAKTAAAAATVVMVVMAVVVVVVVVVVAAVAVAAATARRGIHNSRD
jgi:hypothetical protein